MTKFLNIALKTTMGILVLCSSAQLFAQEATEPTPKKPKSIQAPIEQVPLELDVASDGNVSKKGELLRLEETIRGNKEQPKVLSIVPWQLPLHQRIDRNEQRWAPIKTKLKPLERNSFLKEIKLLEGIQLSRSVEEDDAESQ
jgi:hypothetical protein